MEGVGSGQSLKGRCKLCGWRGRGWKRIAQREQLSQGVATGASLGVLGKAKPFRVYGRKMVQG